MAKTKALAPARETAAPAVAGDERTRSREREGGPRRAAARRAHPFRAAPRGMPSPERAAGALRTPGRGPDAIGRASLMAGLQGSVGNARAGRMLTGQGPVSVLRPADSRPTAAFAVATSPETNVENPVLPMVVTNAAKSLPIAPVQEQTAEPSEAQAERKLEEAPAAETSPSAPTAHPVPTAPAPASAAAPASPEAPAAPEAPEVEAAPPEVSPVEAIPVEEAAGGTAAGQGSAGASSGEADAGAVSAPGTAPAGAAVELLMPEAPTELSPAARGRLDHARSQAGAAATAQQDLPTAEASAAEARAAVEEPETETTARAEEGLVAALGKRPAPSPEIEELCQRIYNVIRSKRPREEEALVQADPGEMANEAGGELSQSIEGEAQRVGSGYDQLDEAPEGTPQQQAQALETPPEAVASPEIGAEAAVPDAIEGDALTLKADVAASEARIEEAGMNSEPAQLITGGPIAEARAAQGELAESAPQGTADVRRRQQEALNQASADMAQLQAAALAALEESRHGTVTSTGGQQQQMVGSERMTREQVSTRAREIFQGAQSQVNTLLEPLTDNAMARWGTGKEVLAAKFKTRLKKVEDWIKERHSGGWGTVVSFWDDVTGLPGWVTEEYDAAEQEFGDDVCALIREISTQVNGIVATCEAIIENARQQISDLFADLPDDLKEWTTGEQARFQGELDNLQNQVTETRDSFNRDLVERAGTAVDEVRTEVQALREAAKGLVGRIADAVNQFLDDPVRFIIDGLLMLVGIPPASFWALVARIQSVISDIADDPLGFAGNLLAAIGQGFQQFFDNIATHLLEGLLDWLFSGLGSVGVSLPPDFSLKSIITFFLQLMGITWPRVRRLLAKHIGEQNVALIEKAYEIVATLIELGPEGIFELIKEKLDPQNILDMVLEAAVDFLIEALIKAVSVRIVMLFNPVGAIAQAIEAIFRVLKWIFENAARIFTLVETVVGGIAAIIAGNISGMATAVEKALKGLIAPVIDFLAGYAGLGNLPDKIADVVRGMQDWVEGILDSVIGFLANQAKSLLKAIGLGGEGKSAGVDDYDGQIGKTVTWSAAGEGHRLWIVQEGANAVVMMSSSRKPVSQQLMEYEEEAQPLDDERRNKIVDLVSQATSVLEQIDSEADDLSAKVGNPETEPAFIEEKDDKVENAEDRLKLLLAQIQEELGYEPSIEGAHRQAVASISNPNMLLGRGPYIQGHRGRSFRKATREAVNALGAAESCHTLGITDPGTRSGNWIPDHQPPEAVLKGDGGPSVRFYPHSLAAANQQRYEVIRYKAKMKRLLGRQENGWAEGVMSSWFWE